MHILLLLSQELRTHGVQSITSELVISLHDLEYIELEPSFHGNLLRVPSTVRLGREMCLLGFGLDTCSKRPRGQDSSKSRTSQRELRTNKLSEVRELVALERFGSVQEVRQIEVRDVVTDHDIRVYLCDEISPRLQHFPLVVVFEHL